MPNWLGASYALCGGILLQLDGQHQLFTVPALLSRILLRQCRHGYSTGLFGWLLLSNRNDDVSHSLSARIVMCCRKCRTHVLFGWFVPGRTRPEQLQVMSSRLFLFAQLHGPVCVSRRVVLSNGDAVLQPIFVSERHVWGKHWVGSDFGLHSLHGGHVLWISWADCSDRPMLCGVLLSRRQLCGNSLPQRLLSILVPGELQGRLLCVGVELVCERCVSSGSLLSSVELVSRSVSCGHELFVCGAEVCE